ncbi:threonine dehydratase [Apostasia shenzhenica]|uniref:Threonine dehydratase n=1 Tax=Apostasia shenzhenica TaxID=1088818 RepID=A0A2I0B5G6_9ASPA|nr:threonine dehydratase [Apostasia shenzhenica]
MWHEDFSVELQSFSRYHIDVEVIYKKFNTRWRFTGFYGDPRETFKHFSWQTLKQLGQENSLPWLCARDFNEILLESEKLEGNLKDAKAIKAFKDTLTACNLIDLGFIGGPFTWWNHRSGDDCILERLDRAVGNPEWLRLFPHIRVFHLAASFSDHCGLKININNSNNIQKGRRPNHFRFEPLWLRDYALI